MKARLLALGVVTVFGATAFAARFDDKEDLAKAAKKAAEVESYKFKMTIEVEGSPMPMDPIEFEGEFAKGITHITGSVMGRDIDAYKKGKKVVTKNQDDEWTAGGGGGAMGAGQIKAPHEELKGSEKIFKEIKKGDKKETVDSKECTIYEGELTDDAAKEMVPGGGARMLGGAAEVSGKGKIFVDEDGVIRKYVMVSNIKASFQGQDLDITATRSIELKDVGKAEVKVPEEVEKLLADDKKDTPSVDPKKEEPKKEEPKKEEDK